MGTGTIAVEAGDVAPIIHRQNVREGGAGGVDRGERATTGANKPMGTGTIVVEAGDVTPIIHRQNLRVVGAGSIDRGERATTGANKPMDKAGTIAVEAGDITPIIHRRNPGVGGAGAVDRGERANGRRNRTKTNRPKQTGNQHDHELGRPIPPQPATKTATRLAINSTANIHHSSPPKAYPLNTQQKQC